MRKGKFTAREREYLLSLPAVRAVRENRIFYSREFKQDCMRRYREGESPSRIFREAGLPPELVGNKRIERCMARWREEERRRRSMSPPSDDYSTARVYGTRGNSTGRTPSAEMLDYGGMILRRYENRVRALEQKIDEAAERMNRLEERLRQLGDDGD